MALSRRERALLMKHLDRPDGLALLGRRRRVARALIVLGLLEARLVVDERGARARRTFATEPGREAICRELAAIADSVHGGKVFKKRNGKTTRQRQAPDGRWMTKGRRRLRDRAPYMRAYKRMRRERDPEFWRING